MLKNIICYTSMLGIIIYLNIRSWNMTHTESFMDPINWAWVVVLLIISGFLILADKLRP